MPGRPDVVHDVDVPDALPLVVGYLDTAGVPADPRVGYEKVDWAEVLFGVFDECANALFV